jgi:hypothetical protein
MQLDRREASRAAWIAGNKRATRIPIMAMTTNNSTSVKPRIKSRRETIITLHDSCSWINRPTGNIRDGVDCSLIVPNLETYSKPVLRAQNGMSHPRALNTNELSSFRIGFDNE